MHASRPARLNTLPSIAFGVALILAVIAAVGRPAVFPDTDDYLQHGRNSVMTVAYALHIRQAPEPSDDPADIYEEQADQRESHEGIAARTPWYGVFLYTLQKLGTLWLLSAVQSAIACWLVWLLWRALAPAAPAASAYLAQGATALLSTLPFFAGFAMPDVFGGFSVIASALLLTDWDELSPLERAALTLLLGYSVTLHMSNGFLAAMLVVVGTGAAWLFRRRQVVRVAGLASVGMAVAVGFAAASLSMAAVKWTTGDEAGRPPFLQARLLADGPGRSYLRWACAHGHWYNLCYYKDFPLDDVEEILWSDDPHKGVYQHATLDGRAMLQHDDVRFAVGTFLYDPVGVVAGAVKNWGATLVTSYVEEPLRDPHYYLTNRYWKDTNLPTLLQAMGSCGADKRGCTPRIGWPQSYVFHSGFLAVALLVLAWRSTRRDLKRFGEDVRAARTLALLGMIIAAVVLNAAICGALSGPFARYQARVAWVLVAAASAALAGVLAVRRVTAPEPALAPIAAE